MQGESSGQIANKHKLIVKMPPDGKVIIYAEFKEKQPSLLKGDRVSQRISTPDLISSFSNLFADTYSIFWDSESLLEVNYSHLITRRI